MEKLYHIVYKTTNKINGKVYFPYERTESWKKQRSAIMKGRLSGEKNPMYGKSRTDEVKKKISEKLKGRKTRPMPEHVKQMMLRIHTGKTISEETRNKQRVHRANKLLFDGKYIDVYIFQMTLDNNIINTYNSLNEIPFKGKDSISKCCKGLKETYKNFIWKFKEKEIKDV